MTAQVPIGRTWTFYPLLGDLFAWSCVVWLVATVGTMVLRPSIVRSMLGELRPAHADVSR